MSASMPIPEHQTANPSSAERTYSTDSTVEYTYYTDPEWAGDAVICTQTGLELNFEKLNNICDSGVLPSKICITLHSSPAKQNGDNCIIDEIVNDNSVVSAHGPIVSQTSKLNQSRTELWSRSDDKTVLTQTGNTAGSSTQSKSGKRKESIIEQEIRIQKNREEELHADRQRIIKNKTTPTTSLSNGKLTAQAQRETHAITNGEASNQMETVTKAMDNVSVTENSVYVSESPIQRDIRISKEREAELRSARDASK